MRVNKRRYHSFTKVEMNHEQIEKNSVERGSRPSIDPQMWVQGEQIAFGFQPQFQGQLIKVRWP